MATIALLSLGFVSCGSDDDDDDVNTSPITLYAGDKTAVSGATSIESENEFIVYIGKEDKSVNGFHVGEAFIKVNGKSRIPVTVKGKYHTYDEPVTEWGCSQSYVKSHQNQGTVSSKSDSKNLIFENVGHADVLMYSFEDGKLASIGAIVPTSYTSEFAGYMSERFLMIPYEKDNDTYFVGVDGLEIEKSNTFAMLQVYNYKYLIAVYMPSSKAKSSSSAKIKMMNKMKALPLK